MPQPISNRTEILKGVLGSEFDSSKIEKLLSLPENIFDKAIGHLKQRIDDGLLAQAGEKMSVLEKFVSSLESSGENSEGEVVDGDGGILPETVAGETVVSGLTDNIPAIPKTAKEIERLAIDQAIEVAEGQGGLKGWLTSFFLGEYKSVKEISSDKSLPKIEKWWNGLQINVIGWLLGKLGGMKIIDSAKEKITSAQNAASSVLTNVGESGNQVLSAVENFAGEVSQGGTGVISKTVGSLSGAISDSSESLKKNLTNFNNARRVSSRVISGILGIGKDTNLNHHNYRDVADKMYDLIGDKKISELPNEDGFEELVISDNTSLNQEGQNNLGQMYKAFSELVTNENAKVIFFNSFDGNKENLKTIFKPNGKDFSPHIVSLYQGKYGEQFQGKLSQLWGKIDGNSSFRDLSVDELLIIYALSNPIIRGGIAVVQMGGEKLQTLGENIGALFLGDDTLEYPIISSGIASQLNSKFKNTPQDLTFGGNTKFTNLEIKFDENTENSEDNVEARRLNSYRELFVESQGKIKLPKFIEDIIGGEMFQEIGPKIANNFNMGHLMALFYGTGGKTDIKQMNGAEIVTVMSILINSVGDKDLIDKYYGTLFIRIFKEFKSSSSSTFSEIQKGEIAIYASASMKKGVNWWALPSNSGINFMTGGLTGVGMNVNPTYLASGITLTGASAISSAIYLRKGLGILWRFGLLGVGASLFTFGALYLLDKNLGSRKYSLDGFMFSRAIERASQEIDRVLGSTKYGPETFAELVRITERLKTSLHEMKFDNRKEQTHSFTQIGKIETGSSLSFVDEFDSKEISYGFFLSGIPEGKVYSIGIKNGKIEVWIGDQDLSGNLINPQKYDVSLTALSMSIPPKEEIDGNNGMKFYVKDNVYSQKDDNGNSIFSISLIGQKIKDELNV